MAKPVTLNVDLGELPHEPDELYEIATVVNVACGGHAGDTASMARAVALARASDALVAAHPSYPDRAGFGRRTIAMAPEDLRDAIAAQCAALQRAAEGAVPAVRTVKLHGALYHDAARDPHVADAAMEGAARGLGLAPGAVIWVGPARGALHDRARAAGLVYLREGFADRGTAPDGSLLPRGQPGALLSDPAAAADRALALATSGQLETLCVHSDTPGAVEIARAVRAALVSASLLASGVAGLAGVEGAASVRP